MFVVPLEEAVVFVGVTTIRRIIIITLIDSYVAIRNITKN